MEVPVTRDKFEEVSADLLDRTENVGQKLRRNDGVWKFQFAEMIDNERRLRLGDQDQVRPE